MKYQILKTTINDDEKDIFVFEPFKQNGVKLIKVYKITAWYLNNTAYEKEYYLTYDISKEGYVNIIFGEKGCLCLDSDKEIKEHCEMMNSLIKIYNQIYT